MTIKELYEASPMGTITSVLCGISHSAMFSLIAVYAASMNFSIFEISFVTFLIAISGAISQWPIGRLSDTYDRRTVIIYSTFASSFFALCAIFSVDTMHLPEGLASSKTWFYIFTGLFAFFSLPLFALIFAHTNDFIAKEKFVAAGAGLQFVFGLGAMSGPFLCSIFMGILGENGYFIFLITFNSMIGIYGIYRMRIRSVIGNPDSQFTAIPTTITPIGMELNPITEPIEEPKKEEVKT